MDYRQQSGHAPRFVQVGKAKVLETGRAWGESYTIRANHSTLQPNR